MDVVFEHSPRKKLDRAWVEQVVAERSGCAHEKASVQDKAEDMA